MTMEFSTCNAESIGGAENAGAENAGRTESDVSRPLETQAGPIRFSCAMSLDKFVTFLKTEGLSIKDCDIIKSNGITATMFVKDFNESEMSGLGFTFGGKKVLKRLLKELSTCNAESIGGAENAGRTESDVSRPLEFKAGDSRQVSIYGNEGMIHFEVFDPYNIKHPTVDVYEMNKFPHGIALIINNESFVKLGERTGTAVDERHLTHAFRYLGYKVEVHREVNSVAMWSIVSDMANRDHNGYDSFVCCILSHGFAGHVFGTDGEEVSLEKLTKKLNAQNCPSLRNKPKLFFLQACRGDMRDTLVSADGESVRVQADGKHEPTYTKEIPQTADFFFGHATPQGYTAWRDHKHGSWFVSELCRTLCEMRSYASLNDIMTKVCERVASNEEYKLQGCVMNPESTTRLRKNVYF